MIETFENFRYIIIYSKKRRNNENYCFDAPNLSSIFADGYRRFIDVPIEYLAFYGPDCSGTICASYIQNIG